MQKPDRKTLHVLKTFQLKTYLFNVFDSLLNQAKLDDNYLLYNDASSFKEKNVFATIQKKGKMIYIFLQNELVYCLPIIEHITLGAYSTFHNKGENSIKMFAL